MSARPTGRALSSDPRLHPVVDFDPAPETPIGAMSIGGLTAVVTGDAVADPDVHLVGPSDAALPAAVISTSDSAASDSAASSSTVAAIAAATAASSAESPAPVDGVAVLTLDDDKDEPYLIFVNDGLCDLTGWRADELLGQAPTKLFARNTGRNEVEAMMRAFGLDQTPADTYTHNQSNSQVTGRVNSQDSGRVNSPANGQSLDILDLIDLDAESPQIVPNPSAQERAQRMLGSMGEDPFAVGESLFGETPLTILPTPIPEPLAAQDDQTNAEVNLVDLNRFDNDGLDLTGVDLGGRDLGNTDVGSIDIDDIDIDDIDLDDLELDLGDGDANRRRYSSVAQLLTRDGKRVPVFFTTHMVATASTQSSTLVIQVHDLRRATAERLLADKAAVVASLSRGHELGQLCHQIAVMVEKSLGVDATCWILIANDVGDLEPVIAGGFNPDVVAGTAAVAQSNVKPVKRVFSSASLQPYLSARLIEDGVTDLWYVPVLAEPAATINDTANNTTDNNTVVESSVELSALRPEQAELPRTGHFPAAAIMVATSHSSPDHKATVLLEHMAEILGTAVSHATSELTEQHQALHDPLTKLPNRALIVDRLGQAMARFDRDGVALSVLLVDIDRFKWINDTHGVDVGDRVLVEVAERLLAAVRLGDTVGRIGSDQFLVICVAANGDLDTPAVGRRILRAVSEPIDVPPSASIQASAATSGFGSERLSITASIGAVVVREQSQPATVIGNAESALSRASSLGRGKFSMFKAEHQNDIMRRHQIEQRLRRAIQNDELMLQYQPIVEISSGIMVGAEALLRWNHPDEGLLGPGKFMPIAEESDLIMALDRWVIAEVCNTMHLWPQVSGRWPLVSINLSAQILGSESLVPIIAKALEHHDLPPSRLSFEITESMQVLDMQTALDNLNRLAELGSRIAIDDFGVGHASFDYLRTFSMASALKIDRSFVDGLIESKEDKAIVTASIAMANSLGLVSVAEGVESVEQLLTLREMGCTYAQGFVLAEPLPLNIALEVWNRKHLYSSNT